jgi:hypothetical protein
VSTGYHTSWRIPEEHRADPAYVEAGAAIAVGQAVYDRRTALGLDHDALAERTGLSAEVSTASKVGAPRPLSPISVNRFAAFPAVVRSGSIASAWFGGDDGAMAGDLELFADDGYLSRLELYSVLDAPITAWPAPALLRLG